LSLAVALTATEVPETVAPAAGAVREMVGAVVSALLTVTFAAVLVMPLLLVSVARTVIA